MRFWTEKKILWGMIIAYIAFFGIFTALRHAHFQTQTWDMGIFDQTFWNTIHGRIMQNNLEEVHNHLGVHMSPWLFILVPGYALFPSPYFLLFIQTVALGLGAWPLYLLAKLILRQTKWAYIITAGYLLYPSLHWVNLFDFHEISFLVPLLLAAFYFIEIKKWSWATLFLILSASTKEDAILVVLFVGIYLLVQKQQDTKQPNAYWNRKRKIGLAIAVLSFIYFLVAIKILMPAFGGGLLRIDRYSQLGHTSSEIIKNVFTHPSLVWNTIFQLKKISYIFWLFVPVAFLPFFSWRALILLIPGFLENLLTNFDFQFTSFYQYDSVLIAGIFIGTIYGAAALLDRWRAQPAFVKKQINLQRILIASLIVGYVVRSPVNPIFFPFDAFRSSPRQQAFELMVNQIPPDVSVAAHTNLIPHLTHREYIYMLGQEPSPVDYVLIDSTSAFGFADDQHFNQYFETYAGSGKYDIQLIQNKYVILKRK